MSFPWVFTVVDGVGVRKPHGDPPPAPLYFQHKPQHLKTETKLKPRQHVSNDNETLKMV